MVAPSAGQAYVDFTREAWSRLRDATPLTLTEADLDRLRGINERASLAEVADVYLPLSRLLNLRVSATQALRAATDTFLGRTPTRAPFVIGIAGSVAVGKSTTARILQALLARWPDHPTVDLVTTDGFLLPNRALEARGLMRRKGFPESYDVKRLLRFLADVKQGAAEVSAPVYSHLAYDVLPHDAQVVRRPDILILEGLNVLQPGTATGAPRLFVSDFFDYSIYVDADERHIRRWYLERFVALRETAFRNPKSYFHRYAAMSLPAARNFARAVWREVNAVNLRENIAPTRSRASLVLEKGPDHGVHRVRMRNV